jgi:hypothetical protein
MERWQQQRTEGGTLDLWAWSTFYSVLFSGDLREVGFQVVLEKSTFHSSSCSLVSVSPAAAGYRQTGSTEGACRLHGGALPGLPTVLVPS